MSALFALLCLLSSTGVYAWDAAAHRLSATIAYEYLLPSPREALISILQQHPRYAEDFEAQMPPGVRNSSSSAQARWLLGQAAVWPDMARNLPAREQQRFNRPDWHWIDGRWLPDNSEVFSQGNVYIAMTPLPSMVNTARGTTLRPEQVNNMMLALDDSLAKLHDEAALMSERAVALCWVMHLVGDIHQPLHAGSLLSPRVFPEGDRGGNAINTDNGNLHARWDQALRQQPGNDTLQRLLNQAAQLADSPRVLNTSSLHWLQESREILHNLVYTDEMKQAVLRSERTGAALPRFTLDQAYQQQMRQSAEQRLLLAGLRLARVLNELPEK
jgi:hypothetical protein